MKEKRNDEGPHQPDVAKEEVPAELVEAVKAYAEAVNADKAEEADHAAMRALIVAAEQAMAHPTPGLQLAEQADRCLRAGDWAGAEEAYRKILAIRQQGEIPGLVAKAQMDLSRFLRLTGRLDEAWVFAQEATACARKADLRPLTAMALRNQAACALARGEAAPALAAATEAGQVLDPGKLWDLTRVLVLTDRARCLLATGDAAAAEADWKTSRDILSSRKAPRIGSGRVVALAQACEVQAGVLARKGSFAEAIAALKEAVEHRRGGFDPSCDPSPYAFEALARDFESLAEICGKAGDAQGERQAIDEARAIWERIHLPGGKPRTADA